MLTVFPYLYCFPWRCCFLLRKCLISVSKYLNDDNLRSQSQHKEDKWLLKFEIFRSLFFQQEIYKKLWRLKQVEAWICKMIFLLLLSSFLCSGKWRFVHVWRILGNFLILMARNHGDILNILPHSQFAYHFEHGLVCAWIVKIL